MGHRKRRFRLLDETFPSFRLELRHRTDLPLLLPQATGNFAISYSSTSLEKVAKFASDKFVHSRHLRVWPGYLAVFLNDGASFRRDRAHLLQFLSRERFSAKWNRRTNAYALRDKRRVVVGYVTWKNEQKSTSRRKMTRERYHDA